MVTLYTTFTICQAILGFLIKLSFYILSILYLEHNVKELTIRTGIIQIVVLHKSDRFYPNCRPDNTDLYYPNCGADNSDGNCPICRV